MAKLIRCPAGHIYDSEAHEACPECARTGVPRATEDARPAQVGKAARTVEADSGKGDGEAKRGMPLTWLIGGGAAAALLIAAAIFLLRPSGGPVQQVDPNSDPGFQACMRPSDVQAEACERAIASGKFNGNALSSLYNNRGIGHQKKSEFDAAISDFAEAIKHDGRNAFAFNNRGNTYRYQHKDDEALADFAKAIEIDAKYISPYNNRGLYYLDKGEVDRAIADFDQVLRLDANYLRTYWNRGSAYLKKGERDRAIADYKKALSLNPNDSVRKTIEAELNQATALPAPQAAASNQTPASTPGPSTQTSSADPKTDPDYGACEKTAGDSSISACDRAIASGKFAGADLGALYRFRGYAKSNAQKPDLGAALADYGEAIRLEPNSFVPFVLRGIAYAGKGEPELAIKDYDRAIELNPRADFYNNRGNALRKTGAFDRAIADLDQAIKLEPNYSSAYWTRGLIYRDKGDKEKAAEDYKKALSLNPSEDAKKEIEALLKEVTAEGASQPTTPSQATPPQQAGAGSSGTAADDTGKDKEPDPAPSSKVLKTPEEVFADPDFKSCRSMGTNQAADCDRAIASGKFEGPALAVLYNNRGQARGLNHDDDAALEDFNKSIELDPNAAAPHNNRGANFSERGEYDRAIADFDKAVELNATQPIIFHGRGLAYWRKGDLERAAQDYKKAVSLNPPAKLKEIYEQELKEIEAGARPTPVAEPAQKQGSADAPPDKNSALSAVREGGSGDGSGLPSTTGPQEGQGSSLSLLPKEGEGGAPVQNQGSATNAPPLKSGPWAAIAADGKGRWGDAVGQPSREAAENAALEDCGSGCKVIGDRALEAPCIAYAESTKGNYWYYGFIGPNETVVQNDAMNACNKATPAGACKLLKSICAPAPGSVPQASANPSASQASADPQKDAESCINTFGRDTIPTCDRAIASGKFGNLDLGTLHNKRGVVHYHYKETEAAIADLSEAIRLDGSNADYFSNRGNVYSVEGDYDKAIDDLNQAVRLAPDLFKSYENRAEVFLKKGLPGPARDDLNKALSLNPDAKSKKEIEKALKGLGPDLRKMKMQ